MSAYPAHINAQGSSFSIAKKKKKRKETILDPKFFVEGANGAVLTFDGSLAVVLTFP